MWKKHAGSAACRDIGRCRGRQGQSAMEYLMTYGWAILVIAVVLGVLFQLGIFSGSSLAAKVKAGSCQVQKLAGGSGAQISLVGVCNNGLPQFVAGFAVSKGAQATGTASGFSTGSSGRTLTAWIYVTNYQTDGCGQEMADGYGPTSGGGVDQFSGLGLNGAGDVSFAGNGDDYQSTLLVPLNTWTFIAASYASGATSATVYMNSQSLTGALSGGVALSTPATGLTSGIGTWTSSGCNFNGGVSNAQVYNTSLSSTEIQALHMEGIGGAPVRPQNIVAWWQLNGDTNDYSGSNNNAQGIVAVTYSGQWTNGYTLS